MNECNRCKSSNPKFKCDKCFEILYCSNDCQRHDWKTHRKICGKSRKDLLYERRKAESTPHSNLESLTCLMKGMMSYSNDPVASELLEIMAFYERAPDLAAQFSEYIRVHNICDIPLEQALDLLRESTANSRALYMMEMAFYIENESGRHPLLKNPHVVFKLINSSDEKKIEWFFTAPRFDVYVSEDVPWQNTEIYHSFSTCPSYSETFELGQTLVAIGFVDLSILLHCYLIPGDSFEPFRFIGYESCAFNVAKTLVISAMLKQDNENIVDAILQVWYSSCWSISTLKCFEASLDEAIKHSTDRDVLDILDYWKKSEPPLISTARSEWLSKISSDFLCPAINCTAKARNSLTYYFLTGQLLDASVGSVVMFQLPGVLKSKRSRDESVFHSLPQRS